MGQKRAAVVGVGYLGNFHAQKYKALSEKYPDLVKLVGVCDTNPAQAQKIAGELGVQAFTKPAELLGQVDMVSIATITPTHYELAKYFLENGVHVNVEKPICTLYAQAMELVTLAQRKELVLTVGHSERFSPVFKEFKTRVHHPEYVELNRFAPFNKRGSDVSVILDLMIHDLDLMLSLDRTSCRLVSASAGKFVTDTHDWASASFEFESGFKAHINCSRLAKEMTRTVRGYDQKHQYVANLQTGDLEITKKRAGEVAGEIEVVSFGRADNLLAETENFILAVHKKSAPTVSGADGMRALELAAQIMAYIASQAEAYKWLR